MRPSSDDRQLTKVLVESHQNATLRQSDLKGLIVAWVLFPVADPDCIMPGKLELVSGTTPDAGVQEKLHAGTA